MKRTFIAVKLLLNQSSKEIYKNIQNELLRENIKWVEDSNLHITLNFIGDTDEDLVVKIANDLESLSHFNTFNIHCKGLGVFKNVYNPRVLWFGIEKSESLNELKLEVDEIVEKYGFQVEKREFKPHLTLGRIKSVKKIDQLKNLFEKYRDFKIQDFQIDQVIFYASILRPQGPIYKIIKKVDLS